MLKIKDNVDLKELEKYGFVKEENDYFDMRTGEKIHHEAYRCEFLNTVYLNRMLFIHNEDLLFDLIKADLVEKVEK